ncbi:hypothetical protein V8F20_000127 [Naviculisporaceae sp. PSN 640]
MEEETQSPDTTGTSPPKAEHKTRRPHRKSRNGCTKCKERRVKCDEATPRCSRCQKTNLVCVYPKRQSGNFLGTDDFWVDPIDPSLLNYELSSFARRGDGTSSPEFSGSFYTPPDYLQHAGRIDSPLRSEVAQTLAPCEFELLRHYLDHTCRDLTVDPEDQYTIQIGIPNLACQSKPLMRSVLALAAICKCCDIIGQPSVSLEDRSQVIQYLALADQYHMQSLREIQATLPDSRTYDHVLANAAMMGMYGPGSHRIRIWLTKTANLGEQALYDFMPKQLQWMSLWRAVDLAYMGIVNDTSSSTHPNEQLQNSQQTGSPSSLYQAPRSPPEFMPSGSVFQLQSQYEYKITTRLERSKTPMINHPLYPILAATAGSALIKLRETASEVSITHAGNIYYGEPGGVTPPSDPALQSCFTAISILANVMTETFPPSDASTTSHTTAPSQLTFQVDIDPAGAGRLSEVSPWMRRYAANITALTPTKLPRRMIPAFIHKVPTSYLNLVTEMISFIHSREQPSTQNTTTTPGTSTPISGDLNLGLGLDLDMDMTMSSSSVPWGVPTSHSNPYSSTSASSPNDMETSTSQQLPSVAHQLALEIFAHWLVLMILNDTVWWIGDLGSWELGRIVNFRKKIIQQLRSHSSSGDMGGTGPYRCIWDNQNQQGGEEDSWWPESMYEVSRQFDKHRPKGGPALGRET